jgi:hypothetical protein
MVVLALLIVIPGTGLFYTYSKNSNHQMISNQVTRIGDELMKNAEIVYFLGPDSRMKLTFNFPRAIRGIALYGDELTINYTTYSGQTEAVFFPAVPVFGIDPTGAIGDIMPYFHTGTVHLLIENVNNVVVIKEDLG